MHLRGVTPISQATPSCGQPRWWPVLADGHRAIATTRRWRRCRRCIGGGSPASLGGPWQGATRRPTARSATAHAREGSSREPRGMGRPRSRIVASIQPPCTRTVILTGCASQDPYRMALVAASLTAKTRSSTTSPGMAAGSSCNAASDGTAQPGRQVGEAAKETSSYCPPPALRPSCPGGGSCRPG